MKVLMLTPSYEPIIGGTETVVKDLAINLNKIGVETDVMTFNMDKKWEPKWKWKIREEDGFKVYRIPAFNPFKKIPNPMGFFFKVNVIPNPGFLKIIKDYDILHFHDDVDLTFPLFSWFVKKPKMFHSHTLNDTATEIIAESIKLRVLKQFQRYALSKIPYIIIESSSIKNVISTRTFSKIYVVPDGIEFEKIEAIQPVFNLNLDIFFIGRLSKEKGVDVLIKAISIVKKSIPNVSAYIAGSGPQENELKSFVKKLNLENHVKFLGFISEEEKYQYYKVCRIVVIPSRRDASPITIYEAMACGKPVIASIATNSEILEDGITGLSFESENVEDLADKIITLLKDEKLRDEMGKAAKEKMKQYDWGKVAERYVEIYKEAIADFS